MPKDDSNHSGLSNSCALLDPPDLDALRQAACDYLAAGNMVVKLTEWAGEFIEKGMNELPDDVKAKINRVALQSLRKAHKAALVSMGTRGRTDWNYLDDLLAKFTGDTAHKAAAVVTGTVGGGFGIAGLAVEIPITTTLILRSISEIAVEMGEDIRSQATQRACMEVFALGGPSKEDDGIDTGFFAVRMGLRGTTLAKLFEAAAARFGIVLTEKFLAQAAPALGALGGGTVNYLFMDYYQKMARVHFKVRKVEFKYDPDQVRSCFESLVRQARGA